MMQNMVIKKRKQAKAKISVWKWFILLYIFFIYFFHFYSTVILLQWVYWIVVEIVLKSKLVF